MPRPKRISEVLKELASESVKLHSALRDTGDEARMQRSVITFKYLSCVAILNFIFLLI